MRVQSIHKVIVNVKFNGCFKAGKLVNCHFETMCYKMLCETLANSHCIDSLLGLDNLWKCSLSIYIISYTIM